MALSQAPAAVQIIPCRFDSYLYGETPSIIRESQIQSSENLTTPKVSQSVNWLLEAGE